ncbi:MAG: hypothetical protein ACYSSI_00245 [Planctomycetota bacterium]|jgi:hypothetical protein
MKLKKRVELLEQWREQEKCVHQIIDPITVIAHPSTVRIEGKCYRCNKRITKEEFGDKAIAACKVLVDLLTKGLND